MTRVLRQAQKQRRVGGVTLEARQAGVPILQKLTAHPVTPLLSTSDGDLLQLPIV